uniref:ATP synthase subunit a n=1 Tax=Cyanidium caldarium TaxID=2771 RepID=A0A7H0WBA9_CYACA|nr:ATP synthase F0 subunit 6 [Cyanidium caldarium]QNR39838.1 ATP synthase F0 subunit 6 [Cyanidium caldarium]
MIMNFYFNSPLEQFEIICLIPINLYGFNISFSNISLFLIFVSIFYIIFFKFSTRKILLVPLHWQSLAEISYEITQTIVQDNLGSKGEIYFPLIFTIFLFLLFCNLLGLIPYSFTITSQLIITFGLALSVFIGINFIGVRFHGFHFFSIFLPKGAPIIIIPLLVIIEFVSYIVKVFTLAIRLFANITSGHTLLKIIAGFSWTILSLGGIFSIIHIIPLLILLILIGLEIGIALLQAYVFALLVCIYLNDVIDLH